MSNNSFSFPSSSPIDNLLIQTLMNRLHLHSPSSDDLFPQLSDQNSGDLSTQNQRRRAIAKQEAKLEKEIIRIIRAGNADETLKANSGQSVSVGEHNICVGVHEEAEGNYRVWEWHGHIMMFDEEDGFNAEYVYGNHFERLMEKKGSVGVGVGEEEEEEMSGSGGGSGLKDLIGGFKDSTSGNGKGRVLHRNFLAAGSSSK